MNFYDLLLAKKLSGGGGGSNYDLKGNFTAGTTSASKHTIEAEIITPSSVTEIAQAGFYPTDYKLKKAILTEVTAINTQGFYNSALEEVVMPKIVTIGASAFYNCAALKEIDLPDTLTSIGNSAFYYCKALTTVYCRAITPPTCTNDIFKYSTNLTKIYVPAESVDAYKAASGWSTHANKIEAIPN